MNEFYDLLKTWCDSLLDYQLKNTGHAEWDGALLCPACHVIHGRCPDLIYPLMLLYRRTGEARYREAAEALFDWGENLLRDDGAVNNDAENEWKFITVFALVSLLHALERHGDLLDAPVREKWDARAYGMSKWMLETLRPGSPTPVNYYAAGAYAMILAEKRYGGGQYGARAKLLSDECCRHITEDGLLFGESKARTFVTETGCRPVDVGYNVEESLPSLYWYAVTANDADVLEKVVFALRTHLDLMLPDGAWDNSFGVRNSKWTYWGSRTSDGCQSALLHLGRTQPEFAEAARRNFDLYRTCTQDGLLHGGPDYARHGEKPCLHHAFCHAKALAEALDTVDNLPKRCEIPSDRPAPARFYPAAGTWRAGKGDWRMTICNQNFDYVKGGHASGGSLNLLWNRAYGPIVAAGMVDYSIVESHNMQVSLQSRQHATLAPRAELETDGTLLRSVYDYTAAVTAEETEETFTARADCRLASFDRTPTDKTCSLRYDLTENGLRIRGTLPVGARYILPVIAHHDDPRACENGVLAVTKPGAKLTVTGLDPDFPPRPIFNLVPGCEGLELIAKADAEGNFDLTVSVDE